MNKVVITTQKEAGILDEALYKHIMQSFQQWKDTGLDAPFLHYSLEKIKRIIKHATVFVAYDIETTNLLGVHCFTVSRNGRYVNGGLLSVSPKVKHTGIATSMLKYEEKYFRKAGINYLRGTTAVPAVWSVNWHLKNGYRIVGYKRSPSNNHYTYVFRKQLTPSLFWSGPLAPVTALLHFIASYTVTRLCKTSTGQLTILGKIAKKIFRRT